MKLIIALSLLLLSVRSHSQIAEWKIADYEEYISSPGDDVIVVNFWATFCKPCIEEIPGMIRLSEKHGAKLLLVSVDSKNLYPFKLQKFVKERKWNAAMSWLNESDADYFCPKVDSKWSGSIPATVIINKKNGKRIFTEGELSAGEFEDMLKKIMQ